MRAARNLVLLVVVAFLIFLIGGGVGWWGENEDPRKPDGGAPTKRKVANQEKQPVAPKSHGTDQRKKAGPNSAPPSNGDLDRRLGVLFKVREAVEQGLVGRALSMIQQSDGTMPKELGPEWAAARQSCGAALEAAVQKLRESLRAGRVLRARASLQKLVDPKTTKVDAALQGLCSDEGWPALDGALGDLRGVLPSEAGPAEKGRRVRVRQDLLWIDATVVSGKGDSWTLRVENPKGVRFPNVDPLQLEFVEPRSGDGLAQASRAAGREDDQLARLWLCYVLSRADSGALRAKIPAGK